MQPTKALAPTLTIAATVAGAIGLFDPSVPSPVRIGAGAVAALVVTAWVSGHHIAGAIVEAAKVKAGATVAAARHQAESMSAASAERAMHQVGSVLGDVFKGVSPAAPAAQVPPGPPPAGAPGSNAGIAG